MNQLAFQTRNLSIIINSFFYFIFKIQWIIKFCHFCIKLYPTISLLLNTHCFSFSLSLMNCCNNLLLCLLTSVLILIEFILHNFRTVFSDINWLTPYDDSVSYMPLSLFWLLVTLWTSEAHSVLTMRALLSSSTCIPMTSFWSPSISHLIFLFFCCLLVFPQCFSPKNWLPHDLPKVGQL